MSEDQDAVVENKNMSFVKPLVVVLVALILGAGATLYTVKTYPQVLGLSKGQEEAQAEVDKLVSEVGKLIALPSDEKPTVATVSDVEKVKEQVFFKNSKNGDKVLIYTNAKKAILYRPSEKRIIEVGAVNINQGQQTENSQTPAPSSTPESSQ